MEPDELRHAVRDSLAANGDPDRARLQQAYMKSAMPCHGVSSSRLRELVTPLIAACPPASHGEWEAAVRALWDGATHREERYAAIALARHRSAARFRAEGALDLYRYLVVTGAWWDLVDDVATHLVRDELLAAPARVAPVVRSWAVDPDLWLRRTAIICQVGARDRADDALLADTIVPNLEGAPSAGPTGRQDFFVRKAIGWALRDRARTDADWVRAFVDAHREHLAGLSVREALRRLV